MTEHGMYGLIQAGIIAQTSLEEHLLQFENAPEPITSGVWRHKTNFIIEEYALYQVFGNGHNLDVS